MVACTYNCFMSVINIGNSIIGVSVLAMPYCFSKCGILLSIALIIVSALLTKLACLLLLKSAVMARRRSFEFLAFHMLGPYGKLLVEMSIIGFLIGVCIAFFVVIGDLGPPLAVEFLNLENSARLRTDLLVFVGLCVALPLGLLRNIDSLTSLSILSIAFYACLILKIFAEAVPNLAYNEWWYSVNWWKSEGILPCLPIFSMALSCQTQIFEFFDTANDPSIKRMQSVIDSAVYLCAAVYVMVGTFGYIAFHDKNITGNILVLLTPSAVTEIIKLGFILTVAVSFPLCLFPCRSSLHSLLFKQGFVHHDLSVNSIPDHRFRILTVSLVIVTIGIAIMLPNIEFVLGIIGSTIGTFICLVLPAVIFIKHSSKMMFEVSKAHFLLSVGMFIMIACTFSTLHENRTRPMAVMSETPKVQLVTPVPLLINSIAPKPVSSLETIDKETPIVIEEKKIQVQNQVPAKEQKRLEPPIPQEPDIKLLKDQSAKVAQNGDLDPQALKKEDKELQNEASPSKKEEGLVQQEILLKKLEEQHEEQKLILEEQKKVLQELKQHKESHELIERKESEKKKAEQESEKLNELNKEQQLVLEQSEKILQELKKQKEEADQSPIAPNQDKLNSIVPSAKPTKSSKTENVLPGKNLEQLKDRKLKVSNNSNAADIRPNIITLRENKGVPDKKDIASPANAKTSEHPVPVLPKKKIPVISKVKETLVDLRPRIISNQSVSDSLVPNIPKREEVPIPKIKDTAKEELNKVDESLVVKRRETLAKEGEFEETLSVVSFPPQELSSNIVAAHVKSEG